VSRLAGIGKKIKNWVEDYSMVAYEFYWRDNTEGVHFIGILPERRKRPERITQKSILNWVWKIIGNDSDVKDIYFVKVEF
jgi:hypothetical protein